jgi:hypothetical protein
MIATFNDTGNYPAVCAVRAAPQPRGVAPLAAVLHQLEQMLERLSDEQFARKPAGVAASSIGKHVRHNLDLVEVLLAGLETGRIDYERGRRGSDVERSRAAALEAVRRWQRELIGRRWPAPDRPLRLSLLLAPEAEPIEVESGLERELAFVLSHTIHHNSLIGALASLEGVTPPADFGYAPATIAHRRRAACAR